MTKIETVSIVHSPPRVLLGMKKVRFGNGKYNGFGGRLENGETLEECAIRETFEECGIRIINPKRLGKILFHFESEEPDHLVYFFKANQFIGMPRESEEMKPEWFDETLIPYDRMWDADKHWIPIFLQDKIFKGYVEFNLRNMIKHYELNEVEILD